MHLNRLHCFLPSTGFLIAFAALCWVLATSSNASAQELPSREESRESELADQPSKQPNILFILTEDQGAQMGAFGTAGLETPHMDALAKKGVFFKQAFVDVPVCSASKAAIYTGLHGHTNGIPTNTPNFFKPFEKMSDGERNQSLYKFRRIPDDIPTLIEILRDANYYTRVTDKLHVAPNEKFPFDEWGPATAPTAAEFISKANSLNRPWFLWYNIRDPHRKFTDSDQHPIRVDPQEVEVPGFLPDTPVVRQDLAEYYDAIERADDKVGAVLEALNKSDSAKNTIIVFMGDHGPSFQRGKMSPYDYGLRVPLVIAGVGCQKGVVCQEVVGGIDLMSTLLDMAGLDPPTIQHGISLKPLLVGQPNAKGHDFLVSEVQHEAQENDEGLRERSLYDGRYRLIWRDKPERPRDVNADIVTWKSWGNRTYKETVIHQKRFPEQFRMLAEIDNSALGGVPPTMELYDTKNDPYELNDLSNNPEFEAVRRRLTKAMDEWAKQTEDQFVMRHLEVTAKF